MRVTGKEAEMIEELYKCLSRAFNIVDLMKTSIDISVDKYHAEKNGMRLCVVDEDGNICLEV